MKQALLEKCPDLNDAPFLLFLSRIHPKKGIDLLIDAYIKIFRYYLAIKETDKLPKLMIAGPGLQSGYGKSLQLLISQFPEVKSSIYFTGMLSGDAKWGAIYCCEAFILPSHQENFGIAVVEALSCRKPVLISNQINIWKEIIENNGGIANNDTLEGTIALIKSWLELSPEKKINMEENARISFEKYFAIVPVANRLINAFESN
jgi:glycosyltransferase involved in cell wall biosynthesis